MISTLNIWNDCREINKDNVDLSPKIKHSYKNCSSNVLYNKPKLK